MIARQKTWRTNPKEMISKLNMEKQCPGNDKGEDAANQYQEMLAKLKTWRSRFQKMTAKLFTNRTQKQAKGKKPQVIPQTAQRVMYIY